MKNGLRTDKQIETLKKKAYDKIREEGVIFEYFTCDDCSLVVRCQKAYDIRNIDGDCLIHIDV